MWFDIAFFSGIGNWYLAKIRTSVFFLKWDQIKPLGLPPRFWLIGPHTVEIYSFVRYLSDIQKHPRLCRIWTYTGLALVPRSVQPLPLGSWRPVCLIYNFYLIIIIIICINFHFIEILMLGLMAKMTYVILSVALLLFYISDN